MDGRCFDAERALAHARAPAFPRLAGTEGGVRAAVYVHRALIACGLPLCEEPFGFSATPWLLMRMALVCSALMLLTAGAIYAENPGPAPFCSAAPLLLGVIARAGLARVLSRAACAGGSGAVNLVSEAVGEGAVRFTLMAHHDSKGQGIPLLFRMLAFAMLFSGSAALCAGLGWAYFSETPVGEWVAPVCVGAATAAFLLAGLTATNRSPGALDNASGVGVLLELARVISAAPFRGVEVEVVSTGAEEMGLMGSYAFLHRHRKALCNPAKPVFVVNLDGVGAGRCIWISGGKKGKALLRDLRRAARECRIETRGPRLLVGMLEDHVPFEAAGLEAVTLSGLSRKLLAIHTAGDGADRLEAMALAGRLVLKTLGEAERRVCAERCTGGR